MMDNVETEVVELKRESFEFIEGYVKNRNPSNPLREITPLTGLIKKMGSQRECGERGSLAYLVSDGELHVRLTFINISKKMETITDEEDMIDIFYTAVVKTMDRPNIFHSYREHSPMRNFPFLYTIYKPKIFSYTKDTERIDFKIGNKWRNSSLFIGHWCMVPKIIPNGEPIEDIGKYMNYHLYCLLYDSFDRMPKRLREDENWKKFHEKIDPEEYKEIYEKNEPPKEPQFSKKLRYIVRLFNAKRAPNYRNYGEEIREKGINRLLTIPEDDLDHLLHQLIEDKNFERQLQKKFKQPATKLVKEILLEVKNKRT